MNHQVLRAMQAPRVLMYHFFCTAKPTFDPENLFVTADAFQRQLSWLLSDGWEAITLDEYLAFWGGRRLRRRKSFLLTIDDAHQSVASIASPILTRAGVPSVLFIPTGIVGGTASWIPGYEAEPLTNTDDLRSLNADMELGIHGYDHSRMQGMSSAQLRLHTIDARKRLFELTGRTARALAYPYGSHDAGSRKAVAEAGYDVAFAVARERGPYARWRICVDGNDGMRTFAYKLSPAYAASSLAAGRVPWLRHRVRAVIKTLAGASSSHRA